MFQYFLKIPLSAEPSLWGPHSMGCPPAGKLKQLKIESISLKSEAEKGNK